MPTNRIIFSTKLWSGGVLGLGASWCPEGEGWGNGEMRLATGHAERSKRDGGYARSISNNQKPVEHLKQFGVFVAFLGHLYDKFMDKIRLKAL